MRLRANQKIISIADIRCAFWENQLWEIQIDFLSVLSLFPVFLSELGNEFEGQSAVENQNLSKGAPWTNGNILPEDNEAHEGGQAKGTSSRKRSSKDAPDWNQEIVEQGIGEEAEEDHAKVDFGIADGIHRSPKHAPPGFDEGIEEENLENKITLDIFLSPHKKHDIFCHDKGAQE